MSDKRGKKAWGEGHGKHLWQERGSQFLFLLPLGKSGGRFKPRDVRKKRTSEGGSGHEPGAVAERVCNWFRAFFKTAAVHGLKEETD